MYSTFSGEGAVRAEPDDVGVGGEDPRDVRVSRPRGARQEDQGLRLRPLRGPQAGHRSDAGRKKGHNNQGLLVG